MVGSPSHAPSSSATRSPISGVAGDPDQALPAGQRGGQVGLRPVRDGDEPDVSPHPTDVPGGSQAVEQCPERHRWRAAGAAMPTGRAVDGRRGPPGRPARGDVAAPWWRFGASSTSASTAATSKSRASPSRPGAWRAAKSVATWSAIRDHRPRRPRSGGRVVSGIGRSMVVGPSGPCASRSSCAGRRSASGGPSTSPGGSRSASASRSWKVIEAVGGLARAVARPASTASAARPAARRAAGPRRARTSRGRGRARCAAGRRCRRAAG